VWVASDAPFPLSCPSSSFPRTLQVLKIAGEANKPVVFLFADTQIKEESFVEDISNLLNTYEVREPHTHRHTHTHFLFHTASFFSPPFSHPSLPLHFLPSPPRCPT
jgi:hypothetical protein